MNKNLNSTLHSRNVLARRVAAACGAGVLLLGAAACGSDDSKVADSSENTGAATQQNGASGGQRPGANGKVAAVDGSTAQVQSRDNGQVAVSWTSGTAFTKQVSAKLNDIEIGDCVMVAPTATDSGSESTAQPTAVTAASVRITEKTDGSCSPIRGGGPATGLSDTAPNGGVRPEGVTGGAPLSGAPADGDGARPQIRGFGGAFGEVKAVAANGFVVTTEMPTADDPSKTTSTEVTVTVDKATTYTTTTKGAAGDVKVGVCVNADGKTDDTGAVTATRIAITPAVEGECTGGMVRFSRGSGSGSGPGTGDVAGGVQVS